MGRAWRWRGTLPRHRFRQLDEDDEDDEVFVRSQTWLGAGEPEAAAPPEDVLGLGLAARALPTPTTPKTPIRITPASRALRPRRLGGGKGGGAFIAP
jgi:hypothetical protein